jgi:hypothetical protein
LKEDYEKGNEEDKKKIKKKIQDIFGLCKQYTQDKSNRMKSDIYEAIKNLKRLVKELQQEINDGFTTVNTVESKKRLQRGPGKSRSSHLDDRTLELLHQLHVIFERE